MTDFEKFIQYAQAFELAFITDDWSLIRPYFADDADHIVAEGGPFATDDRGADRLVESMKLCVHAVDRRFDLRIPEILEGPEQRDGGIWMKFRLRLQRRDLPELSVDGDHLTIYRDGKIVHFREKLDDGHGARAAAYLAKYDNALRAAGSPYTPPASEQDAKILESAMRRASVQFYGMAKSRQDIGAALSMCHPDFELEAVPFGSKSANKSDTERHLQAFFAAFPDYGVSIDRLLSDDRSAACWGTARMSHKGDFLGNRGSGKTATLPFFSAFEFKDGLISKERFFVDLAMLCEQIALPIERLKSGEAMAVGRGGR